MTGIETAIAIAAVGAQAGGTLLKGFQQSAAVKANAAAADIAAKNQFVAGNVEARNVRAQATQRIGQAIAGAGSSGLVLDGSPLDVISQNAAEMELDAMNTLRNRQRVGEQYRAEAANLRSQAKSIKTQAIIGAGTQLLFGLAGQAGNLGLGAGGGMDPTSGPAGTLSMSGDYMPVGISYG